jgi:hypothetical protein
MGTTDNPKTPIIAYRIRLADEEHGNYIALYPLQNALDWLKEEMDACDDYSYTIEPYQTTKEEVDALPEFQGY